MSIPATEPDPPKQPNPAPAHGDRKRGGGGTPLRSGDPTRLRGTGRSGAPPCDPAADPGEPDAAAVRTVWPTVRDKVRQRSRTTEVMLAGATVRAVEGSTLVLMHESAPLAKRLCEQRNADVIAEALKDALGVNWRVRCEPGGSTPPAAGEEPSEEDSLLAEAGRDDSSAPRRDPEEVALELLQNELGARRIDNG
jgi:DNA polymerase III subunit gamma/tau